MPKPLPAFQPSVAQRHREIQRVFRLGRDAIYRVWFCYLRSYCVLFDIDKERALRVCFEILVNL
jgi:hypothetical protein